MTGSWNDNSDFKLKSLHGSQTPYTVKISNQLTDNFEEYLKPVSQSWRDNTKRDDEIKLKKVNLQVNWIKAKTPVSNGQNACFSKNQKTEELSTWTNWP